MSDTPLQDHLTDLRVALEEAGDAVSEAKFRADRERADIGIEVGKALVEYRDTIVFKTNTDTPVEQVQRKQALTAEFAQAVIDRGLMLEPIHNGTTLKLTDPSIDTDYADAQVARLEASTAVTRFEADNRAALKAEVDALEVGRYRDALRDGDLATIREVINGPTDASAALTSDEVVGARERVTTAA